MSTAARTALAAAAGCLFVAVALAVNAGATQRFDDALLRALRDPNDPSVPLGPQWLGEVGRDCTALGGVAALTFITLAVTTFLLLDRKYAAAALLAAASAGGQLVNSGLKLLFDRPRPNVVPKLSYVSTTSFPSGHSMLSAVVYLTLGLLLARLVGRRLLKWYFVGLAVFLTVVVGVSRVSMGVHYPSDVLAGWSAGLAWALGCDRVAMRLQRQGVVEQRA